MGVFRLGKADTLGKAVTSTGFKLGAGKLPQCLFGVHINEPTGNVMVLHDAFRGKEFQPNDAGLDGYPYRAEIVYNPSVGGSEGYQFLVKTYYIEDAEHGGDAENVNGTEVIDGEPTPIPKIYLNRLCRWDFGDVRFQLKGVTGTTFYTYKLIEKVDGVSALFLFKMNENPDTARTVCCYWGKQTAVDESTPLGSVAEAKIDGAVLAMPLDETDKEVCPQVIAENSITNWSTYGTGITITNETIDDINYIKMVCDSAQQYANFSKSFATNAVWSSKSRVRFRMIGTNSGVNFGVKMYAPDNNNYCQYIITDNFIGLKQFNIPFGSFAGIGVFSFNTISAFMIFTTDVTLGTWYFDRFIIDVGVPAVDYSGNGNHGTATGTTVTDGYFTGKTARNFASVTDSINCGNSASLQFAGSFSASTWIKITQNTASEFKRIIRKGYTVNGAFGLDVDDTGKLHVVMYTDGASRVHASSVSIPLNTWTFVAGGWDEANKKSWSQIGSTYTYTAFDTTRPAESTSNLYIADTPFIEGGKNYVLANLTLVNKTYSSSELSALASGYPDPYLEQGKIHVRKWASTTLPTVASVSSMQTRKSYGKQELYPSQDNLNFSIDWVNRKATLEFYLENTQQQSSSAYVLYDGATMPTFWESIFTSESTGSVGGSFTEADGKTTLNVTAGEYQQVGLSKEFVAKNWNDYDFLILELEGSNSMNSFIVQLANPEWVKASTTIIDNFVGPKKFVIPLSSYSTVRDRVSTFRFLASDGAVPCSIAVRKIYVDTGVWAYCTINIPDQLKPTGKYAFYIWDTATQNWMAQPFLTDTTFDASKLKFLNGKTATEIYGAGKGAAVYPQGKRDETKQVTVGDQAAGDMTIKKGKTLWRLPIAVKMQPADLNASITSGGGQCRLKLEVYYQ